jgi:hypothetical protein
MAAKKMPMRKDSDSSNKGGSTPAKKTAAKKAAPSSRRTGSDKDKSVDPVKQSMMILARKATSGGRLKRGTEAYNKRLKSDLEGIAKMVKSKKQGDANRRNAVSKNIGRRGGGR